MEPRTTRPKQWLDRYFHSIQTSDFGSMAVVIGLVIIGVIFQFANKNFLTPLNLTNLMAQIAVIGILSVGIILVLLIGEIDLSVGSVSGAAAAVMAVLITNYRVSSVAAILVAILVGFLIGAMQGFFVGKIHVPSFIVTLAGLMIWQGAQLFILGDQGTINMRDPFIRSIANTLIPPWLGWVIGILAVIIVTYSMFRGRRNRQQAGLDNPVPSMAISRLLVIAIAILGAVALMNFDRNQVPNGRPIQGVPTSVFIFIAFIVVFDLITRFTKFGRHIYTVGGNAEAARRAAERERHSGAARVEALALALDQARARHLIVVGFLESLLTRSLFAQDEIDLGRAVTLLVGARWDEAGAWGSEVSPRASLSWSARGARAWVSVGRAFRAPTLGELYYPYSGNPEIEAEHSRSAEVGVVVPSARGRAATKLVVFHNRTEELIDFDYASFRYVNAGHVAQRGVEASWSHQIGPRGRARVAATWLDAHDDEGLRLLRRPEWSGAATLGLALARGLEGEASLIWVGERPDLDPVSFARVSQPGFLTAALAVRASLSAWLDLRVRVENLADRRYQEVRGYPAPGRRVMLGLESVVR